MIDCIGNLFDIKFNNITFIKQMREFKLLFGNRRIDGEVSIWNNDLKNPCYSVKMTMGLSFYESFEIGIDAMYLITFDTYDEANKERLSILKQDLDNFTEVDLLSEQNNLIHYLRIKNIENNIKELRDSIDKFEIKCIEPGDIVNIFLKNINKEIIVNINEITNDYFDVLYNFKLKKEDVEIKSLVRKSYELNFIFEELYKGKLVKIRCLMFKDIPSEYTSDSFDDLYTINVEGEVERDDEEMIILNTYEDLKKYIIDVKDN